MWRIPPVAAPSPTRVRLAPQPPRVRRAARGRGRGANPGFGERGLRCRAGAAYSTSRTALLGGRSAAGLAAGGGAAARRARATGRAGVGSSGQHGAGAARGLDDRALVLPGAGGGTRPSWRIQAAPAPFRRRYSRRCASSTVRNRPRLLVLDPLVRLHSADENAVVLVHHARKSGGGADADGPPAREQRTARLGRFEPVQDVAGHGPRRTRRARTRRRIPHRRRRQTPPGPVTRDCYRLQPPGREGDGNR